MKIYAEWENNGVFDNGLFNSWDEYYAAFSVLILSCCVYVSLIRRAEK